MMEQTLKIVDNETIQVTLCRPLKRGEVAYSTVTLRAPVAADLEGLSQELIKLKHTDQLQKLVARISEPAVTRRDYMQMSLDDLNALNAAIDFFSAPPAAKAAMREALEELGFLAAID